MPYLLTVFFFIWFNNLLGLMPGGANVTGNIAVTLTLALLTLIITLASSNKYYWQHILNTPGVPWWLKFLIPIMPVVELVGIFTKPFSLMVRLFANITAGHIIILSLLSLIFLFKSYAVAPVSVAFAVIMNCLELFVAILQAYVFTLLSAMYFGGAVEEHHHEEHEHHDGKHEVHHA
jgi:F-type H+-transporting ATPase subunit a